MARVLGNKIKLGLVDAHGDPLEMTPEMRSTHTYICGSTGTGKSKMLEYLIRQDIANWNKSKCGLLLLDPHGSLFATLLLSDLWTAAKERGKGIDGKPVKPFYVYIDEFQNFITPTIAKNLDQARGFGLHLTLANQFPRQILHSGANGQQVYDSIMANARSKIVFSTRGEENLRPLAFDLFMGVMNPDEIKHELYSTKVMDYVEETRTVTGESKNASEAVGRFTGMTGTESEGGTLYDSEQGDARMWNQSSADSEGTSRMNVEGIGQSKSVVPFLRPIIGKDKSSVQFRPLEEQLFRAMAALHDQKQRHGVARLVGMRAPLTIVTPTVKTTPADSKMVKSFLTRKYKKLPFALSSADAHKAILDREKGFAVSITKNTDEPVAVKRRIQ